MALKFGEGYVPIYLTGMGAFKGGLSKAHATLRSTVTGMQTVARRARIGLLLGAAVFGGAVKIAAGFEQGMARVRALTGATGVDFDDLQTQALLLGRTTAFSARQSADAMGFFALAGFKANQIVAAMPATLNLAAAGQLDVAQAAVIAAKVMAGMGIEADGLNHAVDVLAKAFTSANTDLVQLGNAMKYVGPIGKSAGKDIEELVAAIQVMSNAGIQGQMGGTALRNILLRLQAQPAEVKKALKGMGVEIADSSGRMRHLADIVDDVNHAMRNMTEVNRTAIAAQLAGTRAASAFMAMLEEGGDAIRGFEKQLDNAGGTASGLATTLLNTFQGAITLLKSAVEGLAVEIGNKAIPALRNIARRLTTAASAAADGSSGIADAIVQWGKFAMRLGVIVTIAPAVVAALSAILAVAAVGSPLMLGVGALAVALGLTAGGLAAAFGEAALTGESFGDVLLNMVEDMLGLETQAKKAKRAIDDLMGIAPESGKGPTFELEDLVGAMRQTEPGERSGEQLMTILHEASRAGAGAQSRIAGAEKRLLELQAARDRGDEAAKGAFAKGYTLKKIGDKIRWEHGGRDRLNAAERQERAALVMAKQQLAAVQEQQRTAIGLMNEAYVARGRKPVPGGVVASEDVRQVAHGMRLRSGGLTWWEAMLPEQTQMKAAAGKTHQYMMDAWRAGMQGAGPISAGAPLAKWAKDMFEKPKEKERRLAAFMDPMEFWKRTQSSLVAGEKEDAKKRTKGVLDLVEIEKRTEELLKDIKKKLPSGLAEGK
ncbi:MAG: phage tail tape measure protein [Planctomycetota bacterium]